MEGARAVAAQFVTNERVTNRAAIECARFRRA